MKKILAPLPDEKERLEALLKYKILDTPEEDDFDAITKLASYICQTPIALISLIDDSRQWFKSRIGLDVAETPREISFCQYAILEDELLEVPNTLVDDRFKNNPLVTGAPDIRFYAGAPLKSASGFNIGTLCVIDKKPRHLTEEQKQGLETLGKQVIAQLELREKNSELKLEVEKLIVENLEKIKFQKKLILKNVELEKANQKIRVADTFFSLSLDMLFVATGEHFTRINPAFTKLLGYDEKVLLEKPFFSFVHPNDMKLTIAEVLKLQQGIPTIHFINRFRSKDNSYRCLDWVVTPDAQTGLLYGVARDITERKKNEEDLIKARELAEQLASVKDQFLTNMSHEIRTPLNAVIGFTDLLAQTNLNSVQFDYIESVQIAGENLLLIVNDILDLSKIESGKLALDTQPFNLQKALKHVYNLLKEKVPEGVEFNLFLDADLPEMVIGDRGRLNQILVNLTGNALKFTKEGEVIVSVKKVDETANQYAIRFSVKDTGIGIASDKLKTIFERFTQAEESTTRTFGGTGLGLNIVKQLVELHRAAINVKSEPDRGSEFFFVLTYKKSNFIEASSTDLDDNSLGKLKILLCEDNVLNQKLAKHVVNNFGFDLDIAENGQEGIALLLKNKYDLVLMDVQMPVKDGYQTTQYIRNKMNSNIPIIAMTAHSLAGEQEHCLNMGMDGYIPKPFKQETLFEAIKKAMSKNSKPLQTIKVDFSYIDEMSGGSPKFRQEITALFIAEMPNDAMQLEKSFNEKNHKIVKKLSHKMKSSLKIFMLNDLANTLSIIEEEATVEQFTIETLGQIKTIRTGISEVVEGLKELR